MKNLGNVRRSPRWLQILLSVVLLSSLLAGCRLPWQSSSETVTPEVQLAEESAQIPTAKPREDLPPALVEINPLPDSVIGLQQPISLYFNQPMDKDSVEAAIHFEPRISGRFSWENDQIITFTPDQTLSTGINVHLVLDTSAQAINKRNMQEAVEFDFRTSDSLRVVQMVPDDGTLDVNPESVVFVSFNQPVVPLGAEADAEPAFILSPEVAGNGEWLNTSTYVFRPEPSMGGGTIYSVILNESLTATSGSVLPDSQNLQFSFTTTVPRVLNIYPLENQQLDLDGPLEIQFNMRMDPESVEENFQLRSPNGMRVAGEYDWQEDFKMVAFTPLRTLIRNTVYTIQINQDAQSFGGLPLEEPFESTRTTFPAFSVSPTTPPEFQTYYGEFGQYRIPFNTPIEREGIEDHLTINPDVYAESVYLGDGNKNILLTGYFKPETLFTVSIDAGLEDIWGGRLGEPVTYTFSTPPAASALHVITGDTSNNLVFVPAASSELVLQATNINTVTMEISPITIDDLITLLHPDNYDYREVYLPENLEVSVQNLELTRNVSEIVTLPLSYQSETLSPGVYFLQISSPDITEEGSQNIQKLYLIVSENNLVMKVAPDQAFVWATRLTDLSPHKAVPVFVYNTEGDIVARGKTDSDGLFTSSIDRFGEPYDSFFAIAGAPGQEDFGFSISSWGQGYALYEMGILQNTLPSLTSAYIYTDRPIYRPGDTVNFKAVVFSRNNGIPISPNVNSITLSVFGDPGMAGTPAELYSEDLELSPFGTVDGAVKVPDNAPTGLYRIEIADGETLIGDLYFDVAAYRKPEIDLAIGLDEAEVITGEGLNADVNANYYFGLPASDQSFTWTIYRDNAFFNLPGYQVGPLNTSWLLPRTLEYFPLGEFIASGDGETDEAGQYTLDFSPGELQIEDIPKGSLQEYTLEVTITDESGFPVSYRDSALVHPEEFYIGVKPESYFGIADASFAFSIETVDWGQQPLSGIKLAASFDAIEWGVVETGNPEMPYRYEPDTTFIASASPVTNSEGQARVSFTPPEPGTYQLTLESGNAVTQVVVWVGGSGTAVWPRQTQNRVTLTPDFDEYQVGQTAQIFFPNPFEGSAKALVTIERARVMETQTVDIEGAGYTLQVPITEDAIPNIYLSVILLGLDENGNPDYRQGMINMVVPPVNKTLNVDLSLDPGVTAPGENVSAIITITDQQGKPVQGEFSVAVVDKAVLALMEPNSLPILESLYQEQPLSVQTSISLKTYATQRALNSMDVGRGGGGDMEAQTTLREEFPDTAFWQADVVTGSDGTARLSFPMPDSLTTWVVSVRGLSEDYQVGETVMEIITQKDLMIRPVTPRFLVDGDEVELAAVVHNNTSDQLDVDVSLQSVGLTLADESSQSQRVILPAGDRARITWWGTVESVEMVELVFQAVSGAFSDASKPVWGDLQVMRYTMPYTFSTAGQLAEEGQRLELVSLPMSSDPTSGSLILDMNPSLTAALVEGLEALEATRYDDTVSILSRLLANLNTYQALSSLGVSSPQLESNLVSLVGDGIHQLLSAQNFDGGWSWWLGTENRNNAPSDPFITAYVVMGLEQARDAGLDVGGHFFDRAAEYMSTQLTQPGEIETAWQLDRLAFQVYSLRKSTLILSPYIDGLYVRRSELSPMAVGLLGLTLRDFEGSSSRVDTLVGDLESSAVRSATGVNWEGDWVSWMTPGTPLFHTAVSVFTLSQLDPASTSIPLALDYLMQHQNSSGLWSSTFESAWVLMAVTEAMQGTGDYQAEFTFQALLNDIVIAEGSAEGPASLTSITTTTSIESLYENSPNALLIERSEGPGTLYYRVDFHTYQPAGTAKAINRGIQLEREYYLHGEGCPGGDSCTPIESLVYDPDDPSQLITVVLTVNVSQDMYHLMLEDFIPAGTEILNKNLQTTQSLPEITGPVFDPRSPFDKGWGWWHFNAPQIYDDHILWTADYVPSGTYTLTYELLPYQRGVYQVLPSHAWQYFYPEVQGTSAGDIFTIE